MLFQFFLILEILANLKKNTFEICTNAEPCDVTDKVHDYVQAGSEGVT